MVGQTGLVHHDRPAVVRALLWPAHRRGRARHSPFQPSFFRQCYSDPLAFFSVTCSRQETIRTDFSLLREALACSKPLASRPRPVCQFRLFPLAGVKPCRTETPPAVVVTAGFILFRDRLSLIQALGTGSVLLGPCSLLPPSPANPGLMMNRAGCRCRVMYGVAGLDPYQTRRFRSGFSDVVMASLVFRAFSSGRAQNA